MKKSSLILLIVSIVLMLCAVVLCVLHYVIGINSIWATIALTISAILNIIFGIINLKHKKSKN